MSRIRSKDTAPEVRLRKLLHAAGYRFRLHVPGLPGRPDIVLSKYKTAIFVHGCFWHRHEGCAGATTPKTRVGFWQDKFQRTIERDRQKTIELERAGWSVLTIWECELKSDPDAVLNTIKNRLVG